MASTTTGTVVGYFTSESQAETAVSALKAAGFQSNQIGVALAGTDAHTSGTTTASGLGHTAGEKTRSAWERFKGFFDGSDIEPYADESTRGSNVSHEITAGNEYEYGQEDFSHSLSGLDVPEERSRYFDHRFGSQGQGAVVTVSATGREAEAESILAQNGGDVGADTTGYDYSAPVAAEGQRRIQLLGEVLRVQKERISRGEVRIRKEIVTEQQTIQVPVTREELVIERIPVTGTTTASGVIGQDSEIRIPLSEEVASADKQTVVREEVAVGKREVENVQTVGDAVRHEELEVEDTTVDGSRVR
jgi:uncharacterized protein (TIGR02271 family)